MNPSSEFLFDGHSVVQLTKEWASPFFLFSESTIERNFQQLRTSFLEGYSKIRVDYCVKANREIAILKIIRRLGAGAEICSGYELGLIRKAGFHPSQAVFDSPYKSPAEIEEALDKQIHALHADSLSDLENIERAASIKRQPARVVLRIDLVPRSLIDPVNAWMKKFGVPYSEAMGICSYARKNCPHVQIIGLSTHLGSQRLSPQPFLRALERLCSLGKQLEDDGLSIGEINLGGGFPSPGLARHGLLGMAFLPLGLDLTRKARPLSAFGLRIGTRFAQLASQFKSPPTLALQPGRSIVGDAGIAVSRVVAVKGNWVFLDISANCLPESLFFARREILLVEKSDHLTKRRYNVAGRGLNTADNLAFGITLPDPHVGDIAVIPDAGSYTLSRANRYTTLTPPAYLVQRDGTTVKIRRQETFEDIIAPMVL